MLTLFELFGVAFLFLFGSWTPIPYLFFSTTVVFFVKYSTNTNGTEEQVASKP